MKFLYKLLIISTIILSTIILEGCSGARVAGGLGIGVDFGPGGPSVHPSLNVGVYNGGRIN